MSKNCDLIRPAHGYCIAVHRRRHTETSLEISNKVSGVRNADLVSDLLVGLIGSAEQVSCPLKPQFHRVLADTDTKLDSVPDSSDILIYTDP